LVNYREPYKPGDCVAIEHNTSISTISKSRLEFLFDGIFAIAMTILVLELKVPELVDHHSIDELARELFHDIPTFASYLLSFMMLGIFWYRHNKQYHHFQVITRSMLVLHFIQLASAAFFPFCAALVGRYPANGLSLGIYVGCVLIYTSANLANWIIAKRMGALNELTEKVYLNIRTRLLRSVLVITVVLVLTVLSIFNK